MRRAYLDHTMTVSKIAGRQRPTSEFGDHIDCSCYTNKTHASSRWCHGRLDDN